METRFLTEKAEYGKDFLTEEGIYQDMGLTTKGEYLVYRESQGESRLNYLDSPSSSIGKFFLNSLTLFPDTYRKSVLLPYQNIINLSDALRPWLLEARKELSLNLVDADVQEMMVVKEESVAFSRAWSSFLTATKEDTQIMSEFLSLLITIPLPSQTLTFDDARVLKTGLEGKESTSLSSSLERKLSKALQSSKELNDSKKYRLSRGLEESLDLSDTFSWICLKAFSQTLALSDIRRGGMIGPPDLLLTEKIPSIKALIGASGEKS